MEFNVDRSLQKLKSSGFRPSSSFESIVAAVHSILLSFGLVGIYEQPSTVKGFAPSLVETPPRTFLPPNWNEDPTSAVLLYKHRSTPGKFFTLAMIYFDDFVTVTFSQRGGESSHWEFRFADYLITPWNEQSAISDMYQNLDDLQSHLQSIVLKYLPQLTPPPPATGTATTSTTAYQQPPPIMTMPRQPRVPSSVIVPNPFAPLAPPLHIGTGAGTNGALPPSTGGMGVGASDLDPFSNLPRPSFYPGPTITRPEGGSLVGPNHPIFDTDYDTWYPDGTAGQGGFLPGFDAPQPRFDPYGPVTGPNSDVHVGEVGMDYRGRLTGPNGGRGSMIPRPMRGGGRGGRGGRNNHLFPGEPNPDHFKPPGW